jgi:hypothetical protein
MEPSTQISKESLKGQAIGFYVLKPYTCVSLPFKMNLVFSISEHLLGANPEVSSRVARMRTLWVFPGDARRPWVLPQREAARQTIDTTLDGMISGID